LPAATAAELIRGLRYELPPVSFAVSELKIAEGMIEASAIHNFQFSIPLTDPEAILNF
jgi:hypothetical protein